MCLFVADVFVHTHTHHQFCKRSQAGQWQAAAGFAVISAPLSMCCCCQIAASLPGVCVGRTCRTEGPACAFARICSTVVAAESICVHLHTPSPIRSPFIDTCCPRVSHTCPSHYPVCHTALSDPSPDCCPQRQMVGSGPQFLSLLLPLSGLGASGTPEGYDAYNLPWLGEEPGCNHVQRVCYSTKETIEYGTAASNQATSTTTENLAVAGCSRAVTDRVAVGDRHSLTACSKPPCCCFSVCLIVPLLLLHVVYLSV